MSLKMLSIIIPTYNMELLLGRCIDSLICSQHIKDIEIVIVNDGSKDSSLQIANSYKEKYESSVIVIDKENGNYGSCINAALKIIKGKYVKILDADDFFDSTELDKLISYIINEELDCDMIVTSFSTIYEKKNRTINTIYSKENFLFECCDKNFDRIISLLFERNRIGMHAVIYKKNIFEKMNYVQTEGISYTDQEWIFYPVFYIKDIYFFNANIYQYCMGREGQTMNINSLIKNTNNLIVILKKMVLYYNKKRLENDTDNFSFTYASRLLRFQISNVYRSLLLRSNNDDYISWNNYLIEFDGFVKIQYPKIYIGLNDEVIHPYLPVRYINFWRVHKFKRIPYFISNMLFLLRGR